jgi:preprotein translocase SecF subunit
MRETSETQMAKHFTLFNPDANYDFVGRRHVYYALTGIGILASLIALATVGFNKGIDFKGGTKQIMAFTPDAQVDRASLRTTVERVLTQAVGAKAGGDVEVQEFDTGSGGGGDKKHFAVITELTSSVTDAKRAALTKQIQVMFPKAEVEWATEGEDRIFLTLLEPHKITEAYEGLKKAFADAGFPKVATSSDVEVQLDVNLFRSLQMTAAEGGKDQKFIADEEQKLRTQKATELQDKSDTRFTVVVEEFKSRLEQGVKQQYGAKFIGVESSTAVSPSVAGEMMSSGLVAILYAILGIVLYIILRFDVRYAPGALIATLHDVILVIGAFSVAQVKFSMPIIAAVLTVAGYSVTDTIVVFDRIREMQEKHPDVAVEILVNAAINNTMSRTVLTSLTTFMTSMSIFLFGGGLIRDFAFAMCIGVIVGTFSSIFVASPIFLFLHHRFENKRGGRSSAVLPATPAAAQ